MSSSPTHSERSGRWTINNTSKVLALAFFLLLVTQFLSLRHKDARSILQFSSSNTNIAPAIDTSKNISASANFYFPVEQSGKWYCTREGEVDRDYSEWTTGNFTDEDTLCAAHRQATHPISGGVIPRIAFMFITRGRISVEPIWRKFFQGNEDKYSIYVHATDNKFQFPQDSIFHGKTVPSRPLKRYEISFPESVRRILAFALLDSTSSNAWFTLLCETSIPIRSFAFTYEYLINSHLSFVEGFYTSSKWWRTQWNSTAEEAVPDRFMRKGEAWITVHRRHAGLIVGDRWIFDKFKHHWAPWAIPSEVYIPTMFAATDPLAIANHTVMYVDWASTSKGGHPMMFNETTISPSLIQKIQNQTRNTDGFYYIDRHWDYRNQETCIYNGQPDSPCFLFARKFSGGSPTIKAVLDIAPVIGF